MTETWKLLDSGKIEMVSYRSSDIFIPCGNCTTHIHIYIHIHASTYACICTCSCELFTPLLSGLKMDDKTTLTSLLPFSWLPFFSRRYTVQPASSSNIKEQQCLLMLPGQLKYVWWIFTAVVQNVSLSGPLGSPSSCLIHSSITSAWGWGRPPPNVFISPHIFLPPWDNG